MQTLILAAGSQAGSPPPSPTLEDFAAVMQGGPVRVWFGPQLTRRLTSADFTSGSPDPALGFQELAEISGKPHVRYKQEQQKRKSQGRTFKSRTDITGEEFGFSVELLSLHGAAGSQIRLYLSGGAVVDGVGGSGGSGEFEPFGLIFRAENFTRHAAGADYLVGVIAAATADGWEFDLADDDFSVISASFEAQEPETDGIGVFQVFSLAA